MEIKYQLEESKNVLEKSLKNPVQFFAPPGGRLNSEVISIAKSVGYCGICTSRIGGNTLTDDLYVLRRLCIKRTINIKTFTNLLNLEPKTIVKYKGQQILLECAKGILGNRLYDQLRKNLFQLLGRNA
jgi:hypothetical protein